MSETHYEKSQNEEDHEDHSMYSPGDILAITINPIEQYWGTVTGSYDQRLINFKKNWEKILNKFGTCAEEIEFNLEMSKSGRLHWHGYLTIIHPYKVCHLIGYIKYKLKNNTDHKIINQDSNQDNLKNWKKYCRKDKYYKIKI